MELTTALPVHQWYFYDLEYWGLDYPPLTAWHSWLCGKIMHVMYPPMVEFETSRGHESPVGAFFFVVRALRGWKCDCGLFSLSLSVLCRAV